MLHSGMSVPTPDTVDFRFVGQPVEILSLYCTIMLALALLPLRLLVAAPSHSATLIIPAST